MASLERPDVRDKQKVIEYADSLYEKEKWKELLDYLLEATGEADDAELTWRLLRCAFRLGQRSLTAGDSKEAERIADLAAERGRRALERDDRNFSLHKVMRNPSRALASDPRGVNPCPSGPESSTD